MWDCKGVAYPLSFFRVSGVQCDLPWDQEISCCTRHVRAACGSERAR